MGASSPVVAAVANRAAVATSGFVRCELPAIVRLTLSRTLQST